MITVVLVSALVGGIAVSGSAAALDSDTAAPYPHSPGTSATDFPVSVVAQGSDAITQDGMKSMTVDFGASGSFDGSVENVSVGSVSVTVASSNGQQTIDPSNVSTTSDGQITLTFQQPVSVSADDRIIANVANVTTPTSDGSYSVGVSTTTPSGTTDGPVTDDYRIESASLSFPNQSASQFSANQSVNVSGVVPNAGYIGIFTVADNGSRGQPVGSSQPIVALYNERNYTVNLNGNVNESQQLMAVAYYETSGSSQSERLNGTFDPNEDAVVTNNGQPANATGYVTTVDADGRVQSGSEYDQGARLYLDQGEASTGYQLRAVENGSPGRTVNQFETAANGSATIDTTDLQQGQYVITRIDDGSVVSLDNDSTTSAQDDSITITGQQFTESTAAGGGGNNSSANASGGASTAAGGNDAGGNSSGNASGNGSGNGSGSSSSGPGFGIAVAVVALLGAALLATRRGR
ncbi:PGF-CTERM sorting domain-containing protein [Halococcus qingdaonensis]|uniref:PGF-CTERM sorting domain-containing protein n=1 Tax=Halococcus qingdaonensis TaxID=224402 RepID=UPI002116851D|nr:PGF-CTERM sorting domain-containing protein [Halococcus qingdaonensis]